MSSNFGGDFYNSQKLRRTSDINISKTQKPVKEKLDTRKRQKYPFSPYLSGYPDDLQRNRQVKQ